ncbi:hypothetical protein Ciccas_001274 [Cichlidogyrus casuarinus]|uniref:Uncharacterized protein n=1 Tax=Cichlidogyrus casuarinus TaxID=1844966 RepID=A0ABD2QKK3_9PLAT
MIVSVKLAKSAPLLLVQAQKNLLVYHYENDSIIGHITRPPGVPHSFKLPNSNYQKLTFQDAVFAMNDQLVLAAIFCNILVWDVRKAAPLALLHAPISLLTQLHVSHDGMYLLSYARLSKQLHLWNLPVALTNAITLPRMQVKSIPRFERLTKPIKKILLVQTGPHSQHLLAFCERSDEMGLFDARTGELTDLFTNETFVADALVSRDDKYVLVLFHRKEANKNCAVLWDLRKRCIICEFVGQSAIATACFCGQGSFVLIRPTDSGVTITSIKCQPEGGSEWSDLMTETCSIKCEPLLSANDQYLLLLVTSQDTGVNQMKVLDMKTQHVVTFDDKYFRRMVPGTRNILSLHRAANENEFLVQLSNSNMLTDVDALRNVVLTKLNDQLELQCLQRVENIQGGPPGSLVVAPDLSCMMDQFANTFLRPTQSPCTHEYISLDSFAIPGDLEGLQFNGFALNNRVAILSNEKSIFALRLGLQNVAGCINLSDCIQFVSVAQERTVMVGCADGSVLAFALIDPNFDGVRSEDFKQVINRIPSRDSSKLAQLRYISPQSSLLTDSSQSSSPYTKNWPLEPERSWDRELSLDTV